MIKTKKNKVNIPKTAEGKEHLKTQDFLDMCSPTAMRFFSDFYIINSTYRCVWAIREYQSSTKEQAILRHLGEKSGVNLRVYTRHVSPMEERKIISNATNKSRLQANTTSLQDNIVAESNLQDVANLVATMHQNKEPLLYSAVFIELQANNHEELKELQADIMSELTRSKISVDKLYLRQKEGFQSCQLTGSNMFRDQFERVLPASSVANLFPFSYSGKTDPKGFYLGKDKYGSNVIVDFNRRSSDKTNANILILGNSGQGKSYLMKLIITNKRESGMAVNLLDAEGEYVDLTRNLGGCYIDMMSGKYIINVLEPKTIAEPLDEVDEEKVYKNTPKEKNTKLSAHISFLRDFFRSYKSFSEAQIDTLEIILEKLYSNFNITDETDFSSLESTDYPILSDLYELLEKEQEDFKKEKSNLYTEEILRDLRRMLRSMCVGSDSMFFNGHTNITDDMFVCFGVKELLKGNENIKNALLFNILSYMTDNLLSKGNSVCAIDELYLFLSNLTAVEYIRNAMKRVRKKDSAVVLASQNIEDFLQKNVAEMTKPLFAIPTHQFLFHAGNISPKEYMELLQLDECLYDLIKYPERGVCVFRHGLEVYHLVVKAQKYKEVLFGNAGGR